MIIDDISQFSNYFNLNPLFKVINSFITENKIENIFTEDKIITNNLRYIIVNQNCIGYNEALNFFEAHDRHIDVHICFEGFENIIWKNRSNCTKVRKDDLINNDVIFFDEIPEIEFTLKPMKFCIFFPNDVHSSLIGESYIKKIVFKLKIK